MIGKKPKCVKLYDAGFGLFLVMLMCFAFGTYALEKASDGNTRPVTKQKLIEAVSPITPAKTYND